MVVTSFFLWLFQGGGWMFFFPTLIGLFILLITKIIEHTIYTLLYMLCGLVGGCILGVIFGGFRGFDTALAAGPAAGFVAYLLYIVIKIFPNDSEEGVRALIGWGAIPAVIFISYLAILYTT